MDIRAIDEQNNTVREETFGTIMTDGSSPKHNNRVLEIEMGGELPHKTSNKGRSNRVYVARNSGLGISQQYHTKGKNTGERADMSNDNNGEYP